MKTVLDGVLAFVFIGGVIAFIISWLRGLGRMIYAPAWPYAGMITRTRKKKDGMRVEETYFSRGQQGMKATFDPRDKKAMWICVGIIWGALILGFMLG